MQEISVLTIGFALLSFLLGGVIVGLAVQSRSRRLQEAHAEQLRRLREEERKYFAAFEGSEFSRNDVESRLDETQRALDAGARETEILRAQFQEEQEAAYGLEDRLNAAEARLLSADAELLENRLEMQRWDIAYSRLKESHVRLADAHHLARTREEELSRTLSGGGGELEALQSRLDLLQASLSVALRSGETESESSDPAARFPEQLRELALAKVEVQSEMRRREDELTLLRSQLAATRFSLGILAKSGAELASRLNTDELDEIELAPAPRYVSTSNTVVQEEQLANLEGIIADWFEEMRADMPYKAGLLLAFSGTSSTDRFGQQDTSKTTLSHGDEQLPRAPDLLALDKWLADTEEGHSGSAPKVSHDVMLAAIKAASVSALRRSKTREDELLAALGNVQTELEGMQESISLQNIVVAGELPQGSSQFTTPFSEDEGKQEPRQQSASPIDSGDDGSAAIGEIAANQPVTSHPNTSEFAADIPVEEIPVLHQPEPESLEMEDEAVEDAQTPIAAETDETDAIEISDVASIAVQEEANLLAKAPVLASAAEGFTGNPTEPTVTAAGSSPTAVAPPIVIASPTAVTAASPAQPTKPAGIPRADIPTPATPKPSLPMPTAPVPTAAQAGESPPLRTAWGRFMRRVETVLQRPSGRK